MAPRPLEIALVRQRYTPYGGAERFVARALKALEAEGVAVTLIARAWREEGRAIRCDPFYLGRWWRDAGFARCVCRQARPGRFDLVQSHERIACCDIYRAGDGVHRVWLAQRARILSPLARLGQWLHPYHRYLLRAEERLFTSPRLKAVICNSRMVRDEILAHFPIAPEKLHVIYSGVDLDRFRPATPEEKRAARERLGLPPGQPLFAFVGSGFARKGLAAALGAAARVAGVALAVVGRDRHEARYRRLAARLGVAGRVHFAGGVEDVLPWYHAADALVLPTLYDPFPNVALEAMACGLPVLTSHTCGAAELIDEGDNGFVCDALDEAGIAAALERLSAPGFAAQAGARARQSVEAFGLEAMSARLIALYRQLLGRDFR